MAEKRMPVSYDFATLGGYWTNPTITFSIAPDGTVVVGSPVKTSNLYAKMPSGFTTAIQNAAQLWASACNISLTEVSDNGANFGYKGGAYGDIRIGGYDFGSTAPLGDTVILDNPSSQTGDCFIYLNTNSGLSWNIGSSYDVETVVAQEIGHGLGLDHSDDTYAIMYGTYNGVKQQLEPDDVLGIQSIYGPRSVFDSSSFNLMLFNGSDIYPYV